MAGPLRLRYGTGRDLLIGITVVRADGTIARSGGKVVKNVAGYDLGKLFAGSRGTLGLITQATFRLHPLPAQTVYVSAACADPAGACAYSTPRCGPRPARSLPSSTGRLARSPSAPAWRSKATRRASRAAAAALTGVLGSEAGASAHAEPPGWWGAGPAAQTAGTVLQVAFWPGDLARCSPSSAGRPTRLALDPAIAGSAAGLAHVALPDDLEPGAVADFVTALRDTLERRVPARSRQDGGWARPSRETSVVVQHAPVAVAGLVDLFGPVPSLPLMRAVKAQFDPGRRLAPGRFAGGI